MYILIKGLVMVRLLSLLFFLFLTLNASQKVNVFILHSYSQEYTWTKLQHNAFVDTLNAKQNDFHFFSEYLDTKRVKLSQHYQEKFTEYLNNKYQDVHIDLIYVTDDNALVFIYNNYSHLFQKEKTTPVFFSGVNNLTMDQKLSQDIYRGVYEVKYVKENIELIKIFSPQTRDIYFIGDTSTTYASIKETIQNEEANFPKMRFHYIENENIDEIEKQLPTEPRSFVLLTTIGKLKDDKDRTLLVSQSISKIKQNPNIILLTMEDAYMEEGVVGGYVTSGPNQGKEAANLLLNYLKHNNLKNIESMKTSPNQYTFNSKELMKSRIILSEYISRDATIIGKDKNFIENNHSILLNTTTTLVIILLLSIILMYAYFQKKHSIKDHAQLKESLERVKLKLNAKDDFINHIISFGNIGYWRLDTDNKQLFLSPYLLEKLNIDDRIYRDDLDVLSYFTHENDKLLFKTNLSLIEDNNKSITFSHKMVSSTKLVFNVEHIIYREYINHHSSSIIYGIIHFE